LLKKYNFIELFYYHYSEHFRRPVDLFLAEINNIDSESFFHTFISSSPSSSWRALLSSKKIDMNSLIDTFGQKLISECPKVVTFEPLCVLLELAWCHRVSKDFFQSEIHREATKQVSI